MLHKAIEGDSKCGRNERAGKALTKGFITMLDTRHCLLEERGDLYPWLGCVTETRVATWIPIPILRQVAAATEATQRVQHTCHMPWVYMYMIWHDAMVRGSDAWMHPSSHQHRLCHESVNMPSSPRASTVHAHTRMLMSSACDGLLQR